MGFFLQEDSSYLAAMLETLGGVSFPIVFHAGERDSDIGSVVVSSSMEFKNFQSTLSKMIGISSHQYTVYLAEYKITINSTNVRRRMPVTGKVNFLIIAGKNNCFFLVVLKRSRRGRMRKLQENEGAYNFQSKNKNPPEKEMLLRRNDGIENGLLSGLISPVNGGFEYEKRLRKLHIEKEKCLIGIGISNLTNGGGGNGGLNGERRSETVVCRHCLNAKQSGVAIGFHGCAHDTVTMGFRTRAGPIARPAKSPIIRIRPELAYFCLHVKVALRVKNKVVRIGYILVEFSTQ